MSQHGGRDDLHEGCPESEPGPLPAQAEDPVHRPGREAAHSGIETLRVSSSEGRERTNHRRCGCPLSRTQLRRVGAEPCAGDFNLDEKVPPHLYPEGTRLVCAGPYRYSTDCTSVASALFSVTSRTSLPNIFWNLRLRSTQPSRLFLSLISLAIISKPP